MTGLIDLFKEALVYPTKDYKAFTVFWSNFSCCKSNRSF